MALYLAGCATATYEPQAPVPEVQPQPAVTPEVHKEVVQPPAPEPQPALPAPSDNSAAVARILARAQQQLAQGQYTAAIDTAERGLRIDRYAASLYRVLAEAYTGLGVAEQARNFARLGLRYVGADATLKRQLEGLAGQ